MAQAVFDVGRRIAELDGHMLRRGLVALSQGERHEVATVLEGEHPDAGGDVLPGDR